MSIYTTWLQRSSLGGAAQIALVALMFMLALMLAERFARGAWPHPPHHGPLPVDPVHRSGGLARGCCRSGVCALPVVLGFVAPFALLVVQAFAHLSDAFAAGFWRAVRNSIGVAAIAAVVTVALVWAWLMRGGSHPMRSYA